jgi:hypothetical protein
MMSRSLRPALALAALIGAAQGPGTAAQEMQVLQGGEHFEVGGSGAPRDNLAGGGFRRMVGGGQDRSLAYEPGSTFGQPGHATLSGGGEDMTIAHARPEPAGSMLAQQAPMAEMAEAPDTRRRH